MPAKYKSALKAIASGQTKSVITSSHLNRHMLMVLCLK